MNPLLVVDEVTVSFDGFLALSALTLTLQPGELRCIVGPNGAGKTTLQDVITGKTRPTAGRVLFAGRDITHLAEHEIVALGIGRKFQRPTVFPSHTVLENLELTVHGSKAVSRGLFVRLSADQRQAIDRTLELIGLTEQGGRAAGLLSHGQKQWLEIGMRLAPSCTKAASWPRVPCAKCRPTRESSKSTWERDSCSKSAISTSTTAAATRCGGRRSPWPRDRARS